MICFQKVSVNELFSKKRKRNAHCLGKIAGRAFFFGITTSTFCSNQVMLLHVSESLAVPSHVQGSTPQGSKRAPSLRIPPTTGKHARGRASIITWLRSLQKAWEALCNKCACQHRYLCVDLEPLHVSKSRHGPNLGKLRLRHDTFT